MQIMSEAAGNQCVELLGSKRKAGNQNQICVTLVWNNRTLRTNLIHCRSSSWGDRDLEF